MDNSPKFQTGLIKRTLTTAKLSSRLGMSAAKRMLTKKSSLPENAVEIISELAQEIDGMKGLIMKFGQMASYLGAHLPEEARAILAQLQSNSTAMPFESVRSLIESQLNQPIEKVFTHFEEQAFAAASIGQVHRAWIGDQAVAVKVQYPDIEKLLRLDLKVVGQLFSAFTVGTSLDGRALAQELGKHILEECDYYQEAEHQENIRTHCTRVGNETTGAQKIPKVLKDYSSRRVLTTEYVDALPFEQFKQQVNQSAKNRAAFAIFTHSMSAIFSHCYFNGDPHPGNYLFHSDGSVTFLDFGCIKKFNTGFIRRWKELAISILDQDKPRNLLATEALGLIGKKKKFNHDFHWELMNHVYVPYRSEAVFRYTREYNAKTNHYLLWGNKNRFYAKMPADFLFINRLQWGMAALMADLDAEGIWSIPFKDAIYGDETPLFQMEDST